MFLQSIRRTPLIGLGTKSRVLGLIARPTANMQEVDPGLFHQYFRSSIVEEPREKLETRSYWRTEIPVPEFAKKYVRSLCKKYSHAKREEAWKK